MMGFNKTGKDDDKLRRDLSLVLFRQAPDNARRIFTCQAFIDSPATLIGAWCWPGVADEVAGESVWLLTRHFRTNGFD